MNSNELINPRHLGQIASGDLFDSWLKQTLAAASIAATAADRVTRDYRIPVIFNIFESEKAESEDSLIAQEVKEYSLWAVINEAYGWPINKDLMTNSRLSISVCFPEFMSGATSTLNKASLFNYLSKQLKTAILPASRTQIPETSGHVFSKSSQVLSMAGIKLRNQDIYIKLSGPDERVIEDLYVNVYGKHANHTDWLCAVATHVNRSMTFLRLAPAQDDSAACEVATAAGEHAFRVSHLVGKEHSITVSLIDRWQQLSVHIRVPVDLLPHQQINVTVRSAGNVTHYPITVPLRFHSAQDWPFYVAMNINHRVDGLAYGVLQDDGAIVATRPTSGYRIYAWHDSEISSVDFTITEKTVIQWLDAVNHSLPNAQIGPDSLPNGTPGEIPKTSIWEALSRVDGKRLDARPYLEQLIRRCLGNAGLARSVHQAIQLTDTLVFKYLEGNTGFVHAAGAASSSVKRHKFFTVLQVALGEHERQRSIWEREIDVYSRNSLINTKAISAIKTIRDKLSDEFYKDIDKLAGDTQFTQIFETACQSISKARMALYLDAQPTADEFNELAADYLAARRSPQLVVFNQEILPSLIAIARDSDFALLVSVNPAQTGALTVMGWKANLDSDTYLKKLKDFIEPHLSLSQQLQLTTDDLRTLRGRTVAIVPTSISLPRLSFLSTPKWESSLRLQAIAQAKSDIDFLVFSSREQYFASRLRLRQTALRAVSAMVTILLPPALGVTAVVACSLVQATINSIGIWSSAVLANNADRGTDYQRYINEGNLGTLLLAAELFGDASSLRAPVGRLIRQVSGLVRMAVPVITHQDRLARPLFEDFATAAHYFEAISSTLAPLVADIARCFQQAEQHLAIAGWIKWPHGNAYDASSEAKSAMEAGGWKVEVLGVLMFDHPSSELPLHHFALLGTKAGSQIVVDLTLGQYSLSKAHRAYAGSLADWVTYFAILEKNRTRVLLYKCYASSVAASDEMGGRIPGGVAGGSRFIESANYTVAHFPATCVSSVERQLDRLWRSLNAIVDSSAAQTDSLKQISHLMTLRSAQERGLRLHIGLAPIIALRKSLLKQHRNATQQAAQLRLKIEADVDAESIKVDHVVRHLDTLKISVPELPGQPDPQSVASAVAWLVATGLATRSNSDSIAQIVQSYVTGDLKSFVFYDRTAVGALHKQLTTHPDNLAPPMLRPDKLPTPISSRALQDRYLKQLEKAPPTSRGERLFAIMITCQVYDIGNELLARAMYTIETLRHQCFVKLTVSREQTLAGIATEGDGH